MTDVVVEELSPDGSVGVGGCPAAKRLPSKVIEVVVKTLAGRIALSPRPVRAESPDVAAITRATTTAPTATATTKLLRVDLFWAPHQWRSLSCARGRPKAAFVPMDMGKR